MFLKTPSYASRGPAPTRLLPMPLTPTTSPRLRQQSLTTDCALGRQEQMTAQAGKGCLGQGVQTSLLAFF